MVLAAVRSYLEANGREGQPVALDDRDLVQRHVVRVVVKPDAIEVRLGLAKDQPATSDDAHADGMDRDVSDPGPITIQLPWAAASLTAVKGIVHAPAEGLTLSTERREALLMAIAKARRWVDDLVAGRVASFAEIAAREGRVERLIRMQATLAFISPRIITAITNGTASADLTITRTGKITVPFLGRAGTPDRITLRTNRAVFRGKSRPRL